MNQKQMFYEVHRKIADLNIAFMELVNHPTNPMTRADLEKLIEKRPHVYGRFSHFLNKLKD